MILQALLGGVLVGFSAVMLMKLIGRIAGLSGILRNLIAPRAEAAWRWQFALGVLLGSALFNVMAGNTGSSVSRILASDTFASSPSLPLPWLILSGVLVGVGSVMGGGCTSGHGVCGLGRLSKRSLVAVPVFMGVAMLTTWLARHVLHLL